MIFIIITILYQKKLIIQKQKTLTNFIQLYKYSIMSLTKKKQSSIKQYLMDCFDIYQQSGSIDEDDFIYCYEQILSLWNKNSKSSNIGDKYPCGCSRGRGRPRACCKLIKAGGTHQAMKNMTKEEMIKYYKSFVTDDNDEIDINNNKKLNKNHIYTNDDKIEIKNESEDEDEDEEEDDDDIIDESENEDEKEIDIYNGDKFKSHEDYFQKITGKSIDNINLLTENSKIKLSLYAGYKIIKNNFKTFDDIETIKNKIQNLDDSIEYHLLHNSDKKRYSEIFFDNKRKIIISRKNKTKKNSCKISIKYVDEISTVPFTYIKSKISDKLLNGFTDIFSIN